MSKKDYELFAREIFNYSQNPDTNKEITKKLIAITSYCFKEDNQNFNAEKFERACQTGKHIRKAILYA